jgi:hypothetical protein
MSELRDRLERHANRFAPQPNALARVVRRAQRRRVGRRLGAASVAIVVSSITIGALLQIDRRVSEPLQTPASIDAPALPYDGLRIGSRTHTDGWVVAADGWGVHVLGGGTIQNLDPESGEATPPVRIGDWDYDLASIATAGEGGLYVTATHELWTIGRNIGANPTYAVGAHFHLSRLGYLIDVAQGSNGPWVAACCRSSRGGGVIAEVDGVTGSVMRRFHISSPRGLVDVGLTDAGRYVLAAGNDGVVRIDTRTGDIATKRFGRTGPQTLAVTGDRVWWTSNGAVHCLLIDALARCGRVYIPRAAVVFSDGHDLWVLSVTGSRKAGIYVPDPSQPATVTLVDGTTGEVVAGPVALPGRTPASITSYGGHAWVGFHDSGNIVRIDRCHPGDCAPGAGP